MTTQTAELPGKPIPLRVIFILNALMMFLPFVFYYVFTTRGISIEGLDPMYMIYTGIAYIVSFGGMVASILTRKIMAIRTIIVLNVLIAIPAGAYIGMVVAAISMGLTFNKKVKAYFLAS